MDINSSKSVNQEHLTDRWNRNGRIGDYIQIETEDGVINSRTLSQAYIEDGCAKIKATNCYGGVPLELVRRIPRTE